MSKGFKVRMITAVAGLAMITGTWAAASPSLAGDTLVMNINREGTAGYAVGTTIAKTLSKYSDLKISGIPYSSPVAGFRDAADGKCAIPYGSGLDLWQAYNSEGPYAKIPSRARSTRASTTSTPTSFGSPGQTVTTSRA